MAKPKLALIPAAQGSKLFSVLPSSGVGDFDFSRSGEATRINSQGLIETVDDGVSRLNYPMIDGKVVGCPHHILEPARTNLVTYSEDFSHTSWTKSDLTVNSNQITSPSGNLTADLLIEGVSNSEHNIRFNAYASSNTYTYSVFVKKYNGSSDRNVSFKIGGTNGIGTFNLDTGIWTGVTFDNPIAIDFGDDWWLLSFTDTGPSFNVIIQINNNGNVSYQGDGTSGIYIWGAMLEQGSYPTSYIPTNGNAVTRSAETATGSGDAATFNDSEGVLMAEISALADDGGFKLLSINSGTVENHITVGIATTSNNLYVDSKIGNSVVISNGAISANQQDFNKILIKYKSGSNSIYLNGFKIDFNSNTFTPTGNQLNELEFAYYTNTLNFYGKTKQIQYYNSALTDSELEQLTSWTSFSDMANGQLYTIE